MVDKSLVAGNTDTHTWIYPSGDTLSVGGIVASPATLGELSRLIPTPPDKSLAFLAPFLAPTTAEGLNDTPVPRRKIVQQDRRPVRRS